MADTRPGSTAKKTGERPSSLSNDVIGAVDDLVAAAQSPAAPVSKKARRKIQKLGKQLDAVRATEAKRLRQSAKARQKALKRERQAADAAAQMASIVSTIRDTASDSIPKRPATRAAGAKAPPAKGTPAAPTKPAAAAKPATKPAAATKAAAATKPTGATKAATTAKAATRRRTTATPAPKPVRRSRTTTRTPKPKPTA